MLLSFRRMPIFDQFVWVQGAGGGGGGGGAGGGGGGGEGEECLFPPLTPPEVNLHSPIASKL